jgi:cytochrome c oxidase cbb3-type subunit 3
MTATKQGRPTLISKLGPAAATLAIIALVAGNGMAQATGGSQGKQQQILQATGAGAEALLQTPIPRLFPGGARPEPLKNPVANDPAAVQRGMTYFNGFNCAGCHAANGAGGMGRALSDSRVFLYGSDPANIYVTIVQGRPNGMPAWGATLPSEVVWDLVAYIEEISKAPSPQWGTTTSAALPSIEQVPAEFKDTTTPWSHTEPATNGQRPEEPKSAQ